MPIGLRRNSVGRVLFSGFRSSQSGFCTIVATCPCFRFLSSPPPFWRILQSALCYQRADRSWSPSLPPARCNRFWWRWSSDMMSPGSGPLSRLARRLHLPEKRLSMAVNRATGANVSRYVNTWRVRHACKLIEGGATVTDAMLDSGFNTKSNFNREFLRETGVPPSQWKQKEDPSKHIMH